MSSSSIFSQPFYPPPPGVVPNPSNPQTRGRDLTVTCSVFLGIMIIFVSIRTYTKLWLMRKVTWDDLTCMIGFVWTIFSLLLVFSLIPGFRKLLTVTYYALCVRDVLKGYVGYHSWDVTLGQVAASDFYMLSYVQQLVCPLALGFIKLSYFILYLQIFKPLARMKIAIWIGAAASSIFYTLIFALNTYSATPRPGETYITHYLNPVDKDGTRLSVPFAAIGLVFDLYIITLPIYGVCQLQLSGRQKFSVILVFLTGAFACLSAMLTLNYRIALQSSDDILRILVPTLITTLVEMMIGVICTCAPSFSKTLHEHLPSYEILKSRVHSSIRSTSRYILKGSTNSSSGYERRDSNQGNGDYISYKEHLTGGNIAGDRGYKLHDGNTFRTSVGGGPGGFAQGDGIHLKSEILQEQAACDELHQGAKCKWAPTTAVEEANMV